jgi:DNA-binding NarL/FixJ family response regulator
MASFLRSLWQGLLRDLGLQRSKRRSYYLDVEIQGLLRSLAERERRSEEEVASELLSHAVLQRYTAEESLRHWRLLTAREREIVAFVCLGYSYRQIAERLFISQQTVKAHVHSASKKFGLQSKAHLISALRDWDFNAWILPHEK